MTKVFVFDTNSLISAHLLPSSTVRKAFDLAIAKGILVHSRETFSEFLEVFARPKFDKYIPLEERLNAISQIELKSQLIDVNVPVVACRDPKDDKFLALALAIQADCIITGDEDLLVLHPFLEIPILSPSNFLNTFHELKD
jgi:putative PIN family toxin of toxin-antitoxin system